MEPKELTEEDFAYTPDEQQKIANLRLKRTQEQFDKETDIQHQKWREENKLKPGDPVSITYEGSTFIGFLLKEEDNKYTLSTPHGVLKDLYLPFGSICKREIEDVSGVSIPEEFKTIPTKSLINRLRAERLVYVEDYDEFLRHEYLIKQLKAELATREHVASKTQKTSEIMHYEIHITVKNALIEKFKQDCLEIGVKPILIETERGKIFGEQLMTSSKHRGSSFLKKLTDICKDLISRGYTILRKKVEIQPESHQHDRFKYYESHLRIKLDKEIYQEKYYELNEICKEKTFHLSKNLFKVDENHVYQMMTYRSSEDSYDEFMDKITDTVLALQTKGFECDKVEIEECIFDSNIEIDKNWI